MYLLTKSGNHLVAIASMLCCCTTLAYVSISLPSSTLTNNRLSYYSKFDAISSSSSSVSRLLNDYNDKRRNLHHSNNIMALYATNNDSDDDTNLSSSSIKVKDDAEKLIQQAKKMKFEAKRLELNMVLDKIKMLEEKVEKIETNGDESEIMSLRDQIELLELKVEAVESGKKVTSVSTMKRQKQEKSRNEEIKNGNLLTTDMVGQSPIPVITEILESHVKKSYPAPEPLTDEQLLSAVQSFKELPRYMRKRLAEGVNMNDDYNMSSTREDAFNVTAVVLALHRDRERLLVEGVFDAKSKQKIQLEVVKKGSPGRGDETIDISLNSTDDIMEYLKNIESDFNIDDDRRERFVTSIFPDATRKEKIPEPTEEEAKIFVEKVLNRTTFNPSSKPEKIPGGYLIRGINMMNSNEAMIGAVENALQTSTISENVQFFYVRDPYPVSTDDPTSVDFENIWGEPVMVIFNKDISPDRNSFVAAITTLISLACVAIFAVESFNDTPAVVQKVESAYNSGDYDLAWLTPSITPIFFSVLATQVAHELAHQIFALKGKFKTCAPTFIPSPSLPLITSVTKLRTPARNFKDLFDFALSGPLTGMLASIGLLIYGIFQTNSMDPASYALLPTLQVDFIKASSLGGNIINSLMDNQVLSMAGKDAVPLHPSAIAGFCGLMINALSLLPIGQSDGGRIATAVFGRSGIVVAQAAAFLYIFGSGLFGYDPINILVIYGLFSIFAQSEQEVPCLNELDDLDLGRSFLAIFGSVIVALTLIPII